ncbi:MAG TPA: NrfD/PsrC family molybdoenzyme membrane anchor subunit [Dehalococcoidales bacterium]
MAWSAPIYVYLWLAGMAGGSYFAAFLVERFAGANNRGLSRLATQMGVFPALAGVFLLIIDLGNPTRFWHLLTQFDVFSAMSMGTWILLAWVMIAITMSILYWTEAHPSESTTRLMQGISVGLGWLELALSVLLLTYTGVLLATSNRALWASSVLLPPLFVASAVSTGIAILVTYVLVVAQLTVTHRAEYKVPIRQLTGSTEWLIPMRTIGRLWEAEAIVIMLELIVLIGLVTWLGVSPLAGAREALNELAFGTLAVPFWVGVVLLASIIPLSFDVLSPGKELERKGVLTAILSSSSCVLAGALFLRAVIVVGGQL